MIKAEQIKFRQISLRIENPKNPEKDGYLNLTPAKISWKQYGAHVWEEKTINQLIDFLKS